MVVYFASREEYNRRLSKMHSNVDMTLGIYFPDMKTSYFFAGKEQASG